jgi:hypothetical protein
MWGQSAKEARLTYGIDNNAKTVEKMDQVMLMASEIQKFKNPLWNLRHLNA